MGTRSTYGFRIGGKDKLTYNHMDGYPTWLGDSLMKQLKNFASGRLSGLVARDEAGVYIDADKLVQRQCAIAKENVEQLELVNESDKPTQQQIELLNPYLDVSVGSNNKDDWYCLLRGSQGNILDILDGSLKYMVEQNDFINDSLFCEWGYILNFDTDMFEFYRGFNHGVQSGRYTGIPDDERPNDKFDACFLLGEVDFSVICQMSDDQISAFCSMLESRASDIADGDIPEPKPFKITNQYELSELRLEVK